VVIDADGVALIDVLSDRPRVLWRELDSEHRVRHVNRTANRLAALVDVPAAVPGGNRSWHVFMWELPSMTLRVRRHLVPEPDCYDAVVWPNGAVLATADEGGSDGKLMRYVDHGEPVVTPATAGTRIAADSAALSVFQPVADGRLLLSVDTDTRAMAAAMALPAGLAAVTVREHAGIVTVSDPAGRIVAADTHTMIPLAEVRVRVDG
jgi:hypothetical protein